MLGTFHDLNSDLYVKKTCEMLGIEFAYDIYQNTVIIRKKPQDYFDELEGVFLGAKEIVMSRENFVKLSKELELYNYLKDWAKNWA